MESEPGFGQYALTRPPAFAEIREGGQEEATPGYWLRITNPSFEVRPSELKLGKTDSLPSRSFELEEVTALEGPKPKAQVQTSPPYKLTLDRGLKTFALKRVSSTKDD